MRKRLFPTHPLLFSLPQASPNEIPRPFRDGRVANNRLCVDGRDELQLAGGRPGRESMKHLIVD